MDWRRKWQPTQYSCLENPRDWGACWAAVTGLHRVGHDGSDLAAAAAFFTVQLSHPYMTTGKNIALTRWTFVGKVLSLLFNMLSRLVIPFLPRRKCLLIYLYMNRVSQVVLVVKNPPINAEDIGDTGSILGLGRSPGGCCC